MQPKNFINCLISLYNPQETISGDIRDPFFCTKITRGIDQVFHLAALIGIPYSYVAPDSYIDTNPRIYFGPTSINRLHIKLLDEFGRIVDLNNGDFSFSLELEILYDL